MSLILLAAIQVLLSIAGSRATKSTLLDGHRRQGMRFFRAAPVVFLCCGGLLGLAGCGYMLGNGFQAEIRTVCVPTFTNKTFRRNIEQQLTEAVVKRIQMHTPF